MFGFNGPLELVSLHQEANIFADDIGVPCQVVALKDFFVERLIDVKRETLSLLRILFVKYLLCVLLERLLSSVCTIIHFVKVLSLVKVLQTFRSIGL